MNSASGGILSQQFAVFQVCVWRWVGTQPCPTLRDPMDCILPGSSVHGILQATILKRAAIPFSDPGIEPRSPTLWADSLLSEP